MKCSKIHETLFEGPYLILRADTQFLLPQITHLVLPSLQQFFDGDIILFVFILVKICIIPLLCVLFHSIFSQYFAWNIPIILNRATCPFLSKVCNPSFYEVVSLFQIILSH